MESYNVKLKITSREKGKPVNYEESAVSEFGSSMPIRFLDPSQVKMYDSDGKQAMCKCGKPAGSAIIGRSFPNSLYLEAFIAMCTECMYGQEQAKDVR